MIPEKTLLKNIWIKGAHNSSFVLANRKKRIDKKIIITYEVVGSAEENQEILDRVFDKIFDKVLERRQKKWGC